MTSTELDTAPGTDVALTPEAEAALAAGAVGAVDSSDIVIPQLKLLQGQSREVEAGKGEPGEFLNSLIGENLGTEISFVVAGSFKGRFWQDSDGDGRGYGTGEVGPADPIPWQAHPEFGVPFGQASDAEEAYRQAVQDGEKEWGRGPGISTTYNFIGFVPDDGVAVPVRLSLMRTAVPAARTLLTFITRLSRTPWDSVYRISSIRREKGRYQFFIPEIAREREATPEERQEAVRLAQQLQAGAVKYDEAEHDAPGEKPAPAPREGALDV